MAIDTDAKRATSLHYGRVGTAGTTVPSGSSTAFKRGSTLGLYHNDAVTPAGRTYGVLSPVVLRAAR
jgi:hypothetical protein